MRKLTADTACEALGRLEHGETIKSVAVRLLVSKAAIDLLKRGKTWRGLTPFQVSTLGRVRRGDCLYVPRALEARGGYLQVVVRINGERKPFYVHRLVLETFREPRKKSQQGRHLDGDPENNRLDNLIWGTVLENREDMRRHGTLLRGDKHPQAKLTAEQVATIRSSQLRGVELAKLYNISQATISHIRRMKGWR